MTCYCDFSGVLLNFLSILTLGEKKAFNNMKQTLEYSYLVPKEGNITMTLNLYLLTSMRKYKDPLSTNLKSRVNVAIGKLIKKNADL